jgi:hypothetical protein
MIYRRLTPDGDMTFGHNMADFLIDSPETVAQAVQTRLKLIQGEWFLNVTEGTPYQTQILGAHKLNLAGNAIKTRILETEGVVSVEDFTTVYDEITRVFNVACSINTVYGQTNFVGIL